MYNDPSRNAILLEGLVVHGFGDVLEMFLCEHYDI